MVFKRFMQALGVGGPSVETVLANPNARPGGYLEGQVHITGGDHATDIEYVSLGLVTRVEVESGDSEYDTTQEFHRSRLTGAFRLEPGQRHDIPFRFDVPWETPITHVYNQYLHGMTMGLRTELEVARAVDKGDLDQVAIFPLRPRSASWTRCSSSASGSPGPTWSAAGSTASSRRCRSTRRSSSTRRRSTRPASTSWS